MKSKKLYPSLYKWAYATGCEDDIIDKEIRAAIPRQTIYNWRKIDTEVLHEYEREIEIRELFEQNTFSKELNWVSEKRLFLSITKLYKNTIKLYGAEKHIKILSSNKVEFVNLIEEYEKIIPKAKLLEWFQVSSSRYEKWLTQVKYICNSSQSLLCAKKHPYQITKREYNIIKKNLEKTEYSNWSKSAIHSELIKKNILNICRSTFYKHAKKIKPTNKKLRRRKPKYIPLRAEYVNQYWHMDLSYFKTKDGETSFVHAIIDNYSRKIINWKCEKTISKINVKALIEEALYSVSISKLNLISDGGKENFNETTQDLICQYNEVNDANINHFRSLKDIKQSNSMIERFFRTLKYSYLYIDIPQNHNDLCKVLADIIHDYNFIRPHHSLNHLTPDEAYRGVELVDVNERNKRAMKLRIKNNKNCNCTVCTCGGI